MSATVPDSLIQELSFLEHADPELHRQFSEHARLIDLPAGSPICWEGDTCEQLAIVASGVVRVYKVGESGREISLYRLEKSQSCILTASCILSQTRFPALAVAETPVQAIVIPAAIVRRWVNEYDCWREYVFSMMSQRLSDVIATVEEVAFRRMDLRLVEYIAGLVDSEQTIRVTHQEIAFDLGTAREVVSRILKDLERDGLITLTRGAITIQDRAGLLARAQTLSA